MHELYKPEKILNENMHMSIAVYVSWGIACIINETMIKVCYYRHWEKYLSVKISVE